MPDIWDQFPDAPLSNAPNHDPWAQFPDAEQVTDSTQRSLATPLAPIATQSFDTLNDDAKTRSFLDSLPADQRQQALNQWADVMVAKDRTQPSPTSDAINRITRSVPGIGSFGDEMGAAAASTFGGYKETKEPGNDIPLIEPSNDYELQLAYNRAKDRAVDATPTTKLGELPYIGDVTAGGLQKAAGTVGGALLLPTAEIMGGTGLLPGAVNAGVNAGGYAGLQGFGEGEGTQDRLFKGAESAADTVGPAAVLGGTLSKVARQFQPPNAARNAIVQAGDNLGVNVPKFMASDGIGQQTAGYLSQQPIAGGIIRDSLNASSNQLGRAAEGIANAASPQGLASGAADATEAANIAGGLTKQSFNDWIKNVSANQLNHAYANVDALVRPITYTPLSNTAKMAQTLLDRDARDATPINGRAVSYIRPALNMPNGMTYDGIKGLRTYVGQLLDGSITPEAGTPMPALKQLYGSLTQDLRASVQASARPRMQAQALQAFDDANALASKTAQQRESLKAIVGAAGDAPGERVVDRIVTMAGNKGGADMQTLLNARQAAGGQTWGEVASAAIQRMGRGQGPNPGSPGTSGDIFSPDRFLTSWNKLSDQGKNILFGSPGYSSYRSALEDLATVSQRFRDLRKFQNPSGTGQIVGFSTLSAQIAGGVATGSASLFFTPIAQVAGQAGLAKLLSQPAGVKAVSRFGNSVYNAMTGTGGQALKKLATLELAKEIAKANGGDQSDISNRLSAAVDGQ